MGSYRLSQAADQDFESIFDYGIDRFGLDQATEYQKRLIRRFQELADNPFLFPAVDHVRSDYRRSVCGSHSIYYRVKGEVVEIVRILGRQDLSKQL